MVELRWICEDWFKTEWWMTRPGEFGSRWLGSDSSPQRSADSIVFLLRASIQMKALYSAGTPWKHECLLCLRPVVAPECRMWFIFLCFGCNFFDVCTVFDKQTACHNLEQVHNLPQGISLKTGEKYRKSWWEIMHVEQHAFTPNLHLPLSSDPTRHRVQWACSHFCRSTVSLRGTMATRGRQESRVGPCGPGAARAGNAERKDRCLVVIVRRRLGTNCLFW